MVTDAVALFGARSEINCAAPPLAGDVSAPVELATMPANKPPAISNRVNVVFFIIVIQLALSVSDNVVRLPLLRRQRVLSLLHSLPMTNLFLWPGTLAQRRFVLRLSCASPSAYCDERNLFALPTLGCPHRPRIKHGLAINEQQVAMMAMR